MHWLRLLRWHLWEGKRRQAFEAGRIAGRREAFKAHAVLLSFTQEQRDMYFDNKGENNEIP